MPDIERNWASNSSMGEGVQYAIGVGGRTALRGLQQIHTSSELGGGGFGQGSVFVNG